VVFIPFSLNRSESVGAILSIHTVPSSGKSLSLRERWQLRPTP
jgi:hypothetical protein